MYIIKDIHLPQSYYKHKHRMANIKINSMLILLFNFNIQMMKKTEITEKMPIFSEGTCIFYHIEFIEDACRHDWESSSQQVALGTDCLTYIARNCYCFNICKYSQISIKRSIFGTTKTWPYKSGDLLKEV
jgi:hypothetical protein